MKTTVAIMSQLALLLTGCIPFVGGNEAREGAIGFVGVVPVVDTVKDVYGRPVKAADVEFIAAGKTTREELIAKLGPNFRDSPRLSALAYGWEASGIRLCKFFTFVSSAGNSRGYKPLNNNWRAFFVAFDADGKVCKTKFSSLVRGQSLDEQLEAWAQRQGAAAINTGKDMASNEN